MQKLIFLLSLLPGNPTFSQEATNSSGPTTQTSPQIQEKNEIIATMTYRCKNDLTKKNTETIIFTFLSILMKEGYISNFTTNSKNNSFSFTANTADAIHSIHVFFIRFLPMNDGISLKIESSDPSLEVAPNTHILASMDEDNVFLPPLFIHLLDAADIPWLRFPADEYTPTDLRSLIVVRRSMFEDFLQNPNYQMTQNKLLDHYANINQPLIPPAATTNTPQTNLNQEETVVTTTLGFRYTIPNDELAFNFYLLLEDYIKPIILNDSSSINSLSVLRCIDGTVTVLVGIKDASKTGDLILYLQSLSPVNNTSILAYIIKNEETTYVVMPTNTSKKVTIPSLFNLENSNREKIFMTKKQYAKWLKKKFPNYSPEYREGLVKLLEQNEKRNNTEKKFKNIKQL